jgi:hypothetical protein
MQTLRPLAVLAVAFAIGMSPEIAAAQSHEGHDAAVAALVLNDGAKWQGDQNMIAGMTAIRDTMAPNLDAIHTGTLSDDTAREITETVGSQVDFMIENCVLAPEVDEQFHLVLAQITDGTGLLEAGETEGGAVKIVQAVNAYGDHFQHPDWQPLD